MTAKQIFGLIGCAVASPLVLASKPVAPSDLCVDGIVCSTTQSAAAFVDSIGVNVHFNQMQTPYVLRYPLVKQKLIESGIVHARDGAVDTRGAFPTRDQAAVFRELGEAGIRFTFIFKANVTKEFVQGYPAHVAPAFEAYEFPNELNADGKADWVGILRSWAPVFQSYVRSNPATAGYDIIGPSLVDKGDDPYGALGDLSAYIDAGNIHSYYISHNPATDGWGGSGVHSCKAWRYGSTDYKLCNGGRVARTKPIVFTETGWGTDIGAKNQIPESLQAKYLARMLLLHFAAGIPRTHIYQFIDAGSDGFEAYGLLKANGEEKPSYKEIKSLIALMRDSSTANKLKPLGFSVSGNIANVRNSVFQKADGSYLLILWIETSGFDSKTQQLINIAPQSVTLNLNTPTRTVSVTTFQDDGSIRTAPRQSASGEYALTLTDNLTVVQISQ